MFKEIKDYSDYLIYDDGKVWSKKRNIFLTPSKRSNAGHLKVALCKDGKTKSFSVHRLVAEAFIPNPKNLPVVNHKDENPLNNNWTNLEWCTVEYNSNYGNRNKKLSNTMKKYIKENGYCGAGGKKAGEHPEAVKVVMCNLQTHEEIQTFDSMKDASNYLGMASAQQNISAVCRGKRKSCGGFFWKYLDK